jgi:hypothetical protein
VAGYVVSSLAGLEGEEKPDRHGFFVRGWKWKKNPHPSQKREECGTQHSQFSPQGFSPA